MFVFKGYRFKDSSIKREVFALVVEGYTNFNELREVDKNKLLELWSDTSFSPKSIIEHIEFIDEIVVPNLNSLFNICVKLYNSGLGASS